MSLSRLEDGVLVRFWSLDHSPGSEVLWPAADWPKLVYAEAGVLQVEAWGSLHILPPMRALWVPEGTAVAQRTRGRCRVRSLYFHPGQPPARAPGPMKVGPLLSELISCACEEGPLLATCSRQAAMATLLRDEIEKASNLVTSLPFPQTPSLLRTARQYAQDPLHGGDVLKEAGYSRRTLERRFHDETGLSLGAWMQNAKVLAGLRALGEGKTVTEAAIEAGYQSASSFSQSFLRIIGQSPGKFAGRDSRMAKDKALLE
jgi:AraC-like DNA-binding protein